MIRHTLSSIREAFADLNWIQRPRLKKALSHSMTRGVPGGRMGFADSTATPNDIQIAARVVAAWKLASAEQPCQDASNIYWNEIIQSNFGDLAQLLVAGDARGTAELLSGAFRHRILWGMGPHHRTYRRAKTRGGERWFVTRTVDRIVSFAEALGILPCECPEQGQWGSNLYVDIEELCKRISEELGIDLAPPSVAGYHGLRLKDGIIAERAVDHAYTAWRIRGLLMSRPSSRVAEIGAGYGGVAYYAGRLGVQDYHIFDIPIVNAIQGFYLLKAIPDLTVVLHGEQEVASGITVKPWWCLKRAPDKRFELVLNQDSFPEISRDAVLDYLNEIRRVSACFFVSINQEAGALAGRQKFQQQVVPSLVKEAGGYVRQSRSRHWIRPGYVEEIYTV